MTGVLLAHIHVQLFQNHLILSRMFVSGEHRFSCTHTATAAPTRTQDPAAPTDDPAVRRSKEMAYTSKGVTRTAWENDWKKYVSSFYGAVLPSRRDV